MTKSERQEVAATLREWAEWCEKHPRDSWLSSQHTTGFEVALMFCQKISDSGNLSPVGHRGTTAATGLCLAAAMIEAGDVA